MSEKTYTPELQLVGLYHRHIRKRKKEKFSHSWSILAILAA